MHDLWQRLCPKSAEKDAWNGLFAELQRRYREPHRAYHNLQHIEEMTSLLVMHEKRMIDPFTVMMAAFFHDAVLVPGAKDNEDKSAVLAIELLTPFATSTELGRIANLIRETARHAPDPSDPDLCIFIDADLAILAASPDRFREYERGVRKEYSHVPNILYKIGRKKFLFRMAQRTSIFLDSELKSQLEEPARKNLATAIGNMP